MKKSGGGGNLLAADTKGFRPLSLRGAAVGCDVAIHKNAFTMAEILLSLTIIGVVAAITLPSLTGNVNERVWNTQKKALYARFSQALALMPGLSNYGTYNSASAVDTAAETFLTEGLSKVIKINNICDATHLADCGIPTTMTTLAGATKTFPTKLSELNSVFTSTYVSATGTSYTNPQKDIDTKAAAFETQNGESIAVFYNPYCQANLGEENFIYVQPKMCANFVYDLNGNKGPNAFGKDIGFITALYASDPVIVAPQPLASDASSSMISVESLQETLPCTTQDSESRVPNIDELSAMFYNSQLIGNMKTWYYYSSSKVHVGVNHALTPFYQNFGSGIRQNLGSEDSVYVRCVKR